MCTVTYIPHQNGFYLTSNRDEKATRSRAIYPKIYKQNELKLIYPKDNDHNGTWICLKENSDALCLLNGAFENFKHEERFIKSRGLILLKIATSDSLIDSFENINLNNTAPFTLVIISKFQLYECRWDGYLKHIKKLDNKEAYIWSSATLYNSTIREIRKNWFYNWLKNTSICQYKIIDFHKNTGDGDIKNNLVMNRNNELFTVSITSVVVNADNALMFYNDIIENINTEIYFQYNEILL